MADLSMSEMDLDLRLDTGWSWVEEGIVTCLLYTVTEYQLLFIHVISDYILITIESTS